MAIQNIQTVKEAGAIFASECICDTLEFGDNDYADFLITSGGASEIECRLTVEGKLGAAGTVVSIPFKKLGNDGITYEDVTKDGCLVTLGGPTNATGKATVRVLNETITANGIDRIQLKATATQSSTALGCVIAVCGKNG